MQLNVLNDLAEAMKALDGKKGKVTETFHSFLAAGDWERELVTLGLSGDHWVKSMGPVSTSIRGVRYYAVHSRWK